MSIWTVRIRGACGESSERGSGMTFAISARMNVRAFSACASASLRISNVTPVILMSICRAVMPSLVPATLKSMSPR